MRTTLPVFETERLILREISSCDAYDMFEYAKLPFVGPEAGWEPHTSLNYTREVILNYNKKKSYGQLGVYALILKNSMKMIGTVELHSYIPDFKAELGYTINPLYWGNGYALEASKKIIEWGFNELNLKRIECCAFVENSKSTRVCEKLQLTYEGVRRKGYQLYNGYIGDLKCYSIIDDDFFNRVNNDKW